MGCEVTKTITPTPAPTAAATQTSCTGLVAEDFGGKVVDINFEKNPQRPHMLILTIGKSLAHHYLDYAYLYYFGYHQSYSGMTETFGNGGRCSRDLRYSATVTYTFGPTLALLNPRYGSECVYECTIQLPVSDCEAAKTITPTPAPTPAPTINCIDTGAR